MGYRCQWFYVKLEVAEALSSAASPVGGLGHWAAWLGECAWSMGLMPSRPDPSIGYPKPRRLYVVSTGSFALTGLCALHLKERLPSLVGGRKSIAWWRSESTWTLPVLRLWPTTQKVKSDARSRSACRYDSFSLVIVGGLAPLWFGMLARTFHYLQGPRRIRPALDGSPTALGHW